MFGSVAWSQTNTIIGETFFLIYFFANRILFAHPAATHEGKFGLFTASLSSQLSNS